LADFATVGQFFCQGRQLRVKNAASLGWIVTSWGPVLMLFVMMWLGLRLLSLAQ
jgi:hypothetical protein